MLRKLLSTVIGVFMFSVAAFAQGTVTGTVTDSETGETLPGVNVLISELQRGTATDAEGNYTITDIPAGSYTLVATFIGYNRFTTTVEVRSGETVTQQIEMTPSVLGLDELVVTAQGFERAKRALGYAVSEVESKQLEKKAQSDITRILKGKIPGVNITQTSGVSGTATDLVIRGYTTLTGSNQPLFIVDGVRFNTSQNNTESFVDGGNLSTSSRFLDLDPNNIKSVSVLKGLSATSIYGEQGRNGVILITTKNGNFEGEREPGFEVTVDHSVYTNEIASLPDYQDRYGGGFHQNYGFFFSNWGPDMTRNLENELAHFDPATGDGLWIDFRNGRNILAHPYSKITNSDIRAAFPEFQPGGSQFEYIMQPYDNVGPFFRNGLINSSTVNVSGGTEDVNLNLNIGRNNEEGFTPGNRLIKNNVGLGANFRVREDLTFRTTANIALTDMQTPPIGASFGSSAIGDAGSIFGDVFYTPRSVDLNGLPFENPVDGSSVYYRSGNDIQHPLWTVENTKRTDEVERFFGKAEIVYDVMDEISVSYKLGLDTYNERQAYLRNAGGVDNPDLIQGYMQTQNFVNTIWDHNFNVNFNYTLSEQFTLDGLVGAQFVLEKFKSDGIGSTNQIIFDLFEHGNFTSPSATSALNGAEFNRVVREETAGVFLNATIGYEDWIYLNLSGRNDWFSTLEPENRSIFYPSASISFIPTDVLDIGGDILNFLKIRAGVGTSAGAPNPYNTRSTLGSNSRAFLDPFNGNVVVTNTTSNSLGNPNLKPELHTEYELGLETRLWDNRIGLDITAYRRDTKDLITNANLDPATGFTNTLVNIGEIENQGLEIAVDGNPVTGEFNWNTRLNFFTYSSEVKDLGQDLDEIAVAGFTTLGNFAIEGEPLYIMQGTRVLRDNRGRRVVDSNGNYIEDDEIGIIGNPNPKYTLSSINTFNYKNFSLNAQIDYQHGGDIFSTSITTMLGRGITEDTNFDRQVPVILPGVKENGEPNDIQITSTQAFFFNLIAAPDELSVYDATNIRLSELSLSYNLPVSMLAKTPLKQVSVTLSAFNLWYFTPNIPKHTNFDPNVIGTGADNGLGFDFLAGPSSRRFGGSVRIKF